VATHPNVAPEAAMYWPNVRIIPLAPAPYLKMLTVPNGGVSFGFGEPTSIRRARETLD